MKNTRVKAFRDALERLTESLDATIRVNRWEPTEAIPEPLSRMARELIGRMQVTNQFAAETFVTSSADSAAMDAMRTAALRLAAAYGAYQQNAATTDGRTASMTLEDEIGKVRATTDL